MPRIVPVLTIALSLVALASGGAAAKASDDPPEHHWISLRAEHSGKCLTISKDTMENGPFATQSTCIPGADNQRFEFYNTNRTPDQMIQIQRSGLCLSSGPDFSWKVGQRWCWDQEVENRVLWRLNRVSMAKPIYELRPKGELEYCMSVNGASQEDGAYVHVGRCVGAASQRWLIKDET
ncbi:RICIN domain-containing protein [Streptomyces syringium]|uniref:RICIN domain-containing protein n=1 Tax=Streptomyces syringium TaxID=76729 RepID=UPI0034470C17